MNNSFEARVEQSSLGTVGGRAARKSVPADTAARVLARVAALQVRAGQAQQPADNPTCGGQC